MSKKGAKIVHETCKHRLISEPFLQYPVSKPFDLTTDASNYAEGAVLSQSPIAHILREP